MTQQYSGQRGYLRWDDTSTDDQDIWPVEFPQFLNELWDQGLMSCGKRADSNTVNVCVNRLLGNLERSLSTKSQTWRNRENTESLNVKKKGSLHV